MSKGDVAKKVLGQVAALGRFTHEQLGLGDSDAGAALSFAAAMVAVLRGMSEQQFVDICGQAYRAMAGAADAYQARRF